MTAFQILSVPKLRFQRAMLSFEIRSHQFATFILASGNMAPGLLHSVSVNIYCAPISERIHKGSLGEKLPSYGFLDVAQRRRG